MSVGEGKDFQPVDGLVVSGDFFHVLGVEPWPPAHFPEDEHACPGTTVLSYAYWQSKLGGREIDANTKLFINGQWRQIVGVTPPSFTGLAVGERFDVALPACVPGAIEPQLFWGLGNGQAETRLESGGRVRAISGHEFRDHGGDGNHGLRFDHRPEVPAIPVGRVSGIEWSQQPSAELRFVAVAAAGNHGAGALDCLRQPGEPDAGAGQRART